MGDQRLIHRRSALGERINRSLLKVECCKDKAYLRSEMQLGYPYHFITRFYHLT